MARVRGRHHVLGVKHLLSKLRNGDGTVAGGASGGERREADHEEMKTRERHHVNGQLSKVRVKLTGKRRHVVTPDITTETRWFKSPYVGVESLRVRKQMS